MMELCIFKPNLFGLGYSLVGIIAIFGVAENFTVQFRLVKLKR